MARRLGETSYRETAFGIIPRSKLIPLEIEGTKRAWDFVLQKARKPFSITSGLLKEIHGIGFGWIFPEMGGRFRMIDIEVSKHRPPSFYKVPQLMLDFSLDLQERLRHLPSLDEQSSLDELVTFLAWGHHRFLWIHPFQDYNGRIARLLINMILLHLDLPPIELHIETKARRKRYVDALQNADRGDYKPLEKIIADALKETARTLQ